ncbi:uncharacterized protein SPPG_05995 [Spizellomyces punctatus DAOM BR117]|uniref:Uncharacterized protein n=1 Tax=Spizellomyces punctatus (strain DAOM BR117) TaxID=645134 RepID=A0A0L0HDJ5_SPIPD|nr:uncharacterized protein SPPG_05995 [Spizellomyces punctatus DAOM BR117]KNC99044.1 hypothetical protein SPPG_05995 [Spizellomyces punctatus DAOM BR117]|eukprot:XP_016607084.1 hypothetical protein SPPG_05995 [Spizellomyces punctatus DAOM BR117]
MIVRPRVSDTARFPPQLTTINGQTVDLVNLTQQSQLVVILLKDPWCQVCPNLLRLLSFLGLKSDSTQTWTDELTSETRSITQSQKAFNHVLLAHDTRFLVICPGPPEALKQIAEETGWSELDRVDFVADVDFGIGEMLGLRMVAGVWPSSLEVLKDLTVTTIEIGRSPGYYGDHAILQHLATHRHQTETQAVTLLRQSTRLHKLLQTTTTKSTYYNHPARDVLPLELLCSLFDQVAQSELDRHIQDQPSLAQASKACKSWQYVALLTTTRILSEQIKTLESALTTVNGCPIACEIETRWGYPPGAKIQFVPLLDIKRRLARLQKVWKWVSGFVDEVGLDVWK